MMLWHAPPSTEMFPLPALSSGQSSASRGVSVPFCCSAGSGAEWSAAPSALSLLHMHAVGSELVVHFEAAAHTTASNAALTCPAMQHSPARYVRVVTIGLWLR